MPKYQDPFANTEFSTTFFDSLSPVAPPKPEGVGEKVKRVVSDLGASFGQGAGSMVQGVGTLMGGSDSGLAELGANASDHWQNAKSEQLKAEEAQFGEDMANPDIGALGVAGKVLTNPYLASSMLAASAPAMAVGMGAGGLVARGMIGAGVMTDATAGGLTALGGRVAGGVGEGLAIAPDVYQNTKGSAEASVAGLALGVITNMITPGNVSGAAVRKMTGATESAVESAFNKTVARRVGSAVAGEAAQEYTQEGGQALLEQAGRGESFDLGAANKQAAIGATLGGIMGAGLHPVVGEGSPHAAATPEGEAVAVREEALAADPNNPVLQAEVAHARAIDQQAINPTPENELAATATGANLAAARNPEDRGLRDQADMATASVALNAVGADGARVSSDIAHAATHQAITEAADIDTALTAFAAGEQAGSTLRTTAAGIQATVEGVQEASHTIDEAAYPVEEVTPEQEAKQRMANEIHRLKTANLEIKNQTQEARLAHEVAKVKNESPEVTGLEVKELNTAEQVRSQYDPLIAEQEKIADEEWRPQDERDTAYSRAEALRAERDKFTPAKEAAPASTRGGYEVVPNLDGGYDVIDSNMGVYANFNGSDAEQDAGAVARNLNMRLGVNTAAAAPVPVAEQRGGDEGPELVIKAAQGMRDEGYSTDVIANMRKEEPSRLRAEMNRVDSTPARRRLAHALLWTRGSEVISPARFEARESELEAGLREALGDRYDSDHQTVRRNMAVHDEGMIANLASGNGTVPQQRRAARAALAFRRGTHMGDIDAPRSAATAPRRSTAELLREAAAEVADETTPRTQAPSATANFGDRARAALADGSIRKLAKFMQNVMAGRGQRALSVNTRSLANTATIRNVTQAKLDRLKNIYNAALREKALAWAEENNQLPPQDLDPVVGVTKSEGGIRITVRGLGRNGANPYAVTGPETGYATMSASDHHMTTTGIDDVPGASNLAYRLAAELGSMFGKSVPASATLLTNNNFRRHMQSVYADSIFGPDVISPLSPMGRETQQGVPEQLWSDADAEERVGINLLRAAHQMTVNRANGTQTLGAFMSNLRYNTAGEIVAVTDPANSHGFAKGTVVTDADLLAKLLASQTATIAGNQTVERSAIGRTGMGGIGLDTAKLGIMINSAMDKVEGKPNGTIPQSMVTKAKQLGRQMGGWMFSEGAEGSVKNPITTEAAIERVKALLGDNVGRLLLDSGMINFVDSPSALTGDIFSDAQGNVQGATAPDGTITLVTGSLTDETFDGVLLHEGLHSTLKALVGEEVYGQLMSRLETLLAAGKGSEWLKNAEARIPANTPTKSRTEELAAYAVELSEDDGNPLVRWAKDFMSTVRAALIKSKFVPEKLRVWAINNIQAGDLKKLALAGLRKAAISGDGATKLSTSLRSAESYQDEIAALMQEHAAEGTSGPRRAEINTKVAKLRTAWRMAEESEYESARYSTSPVQEEHPQELNIAKLSWRKPFERLVEKFRAAFQQKHVTLERLLREANVTAENLRMDTIGALDRLGSKLATKQKDLVLRPMAEVENVLANAGFADGGAAREAFDNFLKNNHAAEYNEHIAQINPARYETVDGQEIYISGYDAEHPGSGIPTDVANAAIAEIRTKAATGDTKALAIMAANKIYRNMIDQLQQYAVDQGLEKQQTIDTWKEKFPNYTPFNRNLDLHENLSIGTVPGSQGFSLRTGIGRRAMGSAAEIVSPLASTLLFGLKTATRGENAVVARTVLNFAREFVPNFRDRAGNWVPMWSVESIPNQRVVKKVNVYRVALGDGTLSPEYYNRQQATDYANSQQQAWVQANPGQSRSASGIEVQQVGDGPQNRVVVQQIPNALNNQDVMVIPEDGENKMIVFNKHSEDAMAVLDALKGKSSSGSGAAAINKWLVGPRMFSRWVVATSTGYNPTFMFFNAARDIQGAMISVNSDNIPGWTANDSLSIAKDFLPAATDIWHQENAEFKALHSNEGAAPEPTQGGYAWYAGKMAEFGGATGVASSIVDQETAETQLRRLYGQEKLTEMSGQNEAVDWLSNMNRGFVKLGDKFARFGEGETSTPLMGWISKHLVSEVSRLNSATELATRTLVFKKATERFVEAGRSENEAMQLAANISKNVSTNFNRRGNASTYINQLYPFFNAALQGGARLAESLFEKETYTFNQDGRVVTDQRTKMTPFGKKVVGALIGLGGLQSALLAMAGYDDDDLPQQVKDRAFIVPLPGGNYVAIPMPHGFNTVVNFGREITDAALNPAKAMQHVSRAVVSQASAFNPFGSAGNMITDFLPAIFDAPTSLYMNKDAFGRPIAKESPNSANPTPGFARAKEGASKIGRVIAESLNTLSGGNEDQSGFLSPTPDQIDFAMGQITGGVGREIGKAGQMFTGLAQDIAGIEREKTPLYKVPLIGRLVGSIDDPTALRSKLFNIRTSINDAYARYDGLKERGDIDGANEFFDEHPELALRNRVESFARKDSKQRKARAMARGSDDVARVNEISEAQDAKIADLISEYQNFKKKK